MKPDPNRPPLYTVWEEFCGWTLDTTAKIPKSQRFSFGQRIDAHALDVLELVIRCIYTKDKAAGLQRVNLKQEVLRTLWRRWCRSAAGSPCGNWTMRRRSSTRPAAWSAADFRGAPRRGGAGIGQRAGMGVW